MTSDFEISDPEAGLHAHARTCGFALDVFIASVLETLATTTGDALGRRPVTFILGSPISSNANDPVDIYMISLLIPSIINGFLIGVSEYLMNVLHAVWIYFRTLQGALRSSRQGLQIVTACYHLCFQIFHITNKTHGFKKPHLACI